LTTRKLSVIEENVLDACENENDYTPKNKAKEPCNKQQTVNKSGVKEVGKIFTLDKQKQIDDVYDEKAALKDH